LLATTDVRLNLSNTGGYDRSPTAESLP